MPEESLNNQRLYDPVLSLVLHSQTPSIRYMAGDAASLKWTLG